MLFPCLDSYFLKLKKLKTVLKLRFLDNFSKAEGKECNQKDWMSVITLKLLQLLQLHIICKWVHPFHSKQPPSPLYEVKKL